jgi:hypothetical protein
VTVDRKAGERAGRSVDLSLPHRSLATRGTSGRPVHSSRSCESFPGATSVDHPNPSRVVQRRCRGSQLSRRAKWTQDRSSKARTTHPASQPQPDSLAYITTSILSHPRSSVAVVSSRKRDSSQLRFPPKTTLFAERCRFLPRPEIVDAAHPIPAAIANEPRRTARGLESHL